MRIFLSLILACFTSFLSAQGGFRARNYIPGALTNIAKAMFETSPGNYIASGFILDADGNNRLIMMGLGSNGQMLWHKKYGNDKFMYLDNFFINRSFYKQENNLYYAGCVQDSLGKYFGVLIKFDLNGDTLWQKIYRDPLQDVIPQMVNKSVDGGFLITGYSQNSGVNCLIIKTDANGNEIWRKKIHKGAPNVQDGKAIVQDSATKKIVIIGYQLTGFVSSPVHSDNVLILDSLGNKLSQHNYNGIGGNILDMIQTRDKKIMAVGYQYYPQTVGGNPLMKSYVVKFDLNNPSSPIWKINDFDKLTLANSFACLKEFNNGDVLISGVIDTMQILNLPTRCLNRLTKIDKDGVIKWNRYYDYKINDNASDNNLSNASLEFTNDGGWIAAVKVLNSPSPNPFFFVKYDSTGCDSTLAYCKMLAEVGVNKLKIENEELKIYPNPAKDLLTIEGGSERAIDVVEASFTDIYGREVKKVRIIQSRRIDVRDLSIGIYLITVSKDGKTVYKTKIIKE